MTYMSSILSENEQKLANHRSNREKRRMIGRMVVKKGTDSLGRRVRDLRLAYEWQQEELADRMAEITGQRVGQGYISDVERGKANPNWKTVAALARALETTADYLCLLTDNPATLLDTTNSHWSEQADEAGRIMDALPEDWRSVALDEVKKVDAEWRDIQRQDGELVEWLRKIESAGGPLARAIAEQYIRSRLDALSRRGRARGVIDEASAESRDFGQ